MTKAECIKMEQKNFREKMRKLRATPEVNGYGVSAALGKVAIGKDIIIEELGQELHKLKEQLGDYKIGSYWIPYDGLVCVDYTFGNHTVRFRIKTKDEQSVVNVLSNGKCNVQVTSSKSIVCEL